jgi:hypothetical protein
MTAGGVLLIVGAPFHATLKVLLCQRLALLRYVAVLLQTSHVLLHHLRCRAMTVRLCCHAMVSQNVTFPPDHLIGTVDKDRMISPVCIPQSGQAETPPCLGAWVQRRVRHQKRPPRSWWVPAAGLLCQEQEVAICPLLNRHVALLRCTDVFACCHAAASLRATLGPQTHAGSVNLILVGCRNKSKHMMNAVQLRSAK